MAARREEDRIVTIQNKEPNKEADERKKEIYLSYKHRRHIDSYIFSGSGTLIGVHQMILYCGSGYFKKQIDSLGAGGNSAIEPQFAVDVPDQFLRILIDLMYLGQVLVPHEILPTIIRYTEDFKMNATVRSYQPDGLVLVASEPQHIKPKRTPHNSTGSSPRLSSNPSSSLSPRPTSSTSQVSPSSSASTLTPASGAEHASAAQLPSVMERVSPGHASAAQLPTAHVLPAPAEQMPVRRYTPYLSTSGAQAQADRTDRSSPVQIIPAIASHAPPRNGRKSSTPRRITSPISEDANEEEEGRLMIVEEEEEEEKKEVVRGEPQKKRKKSILSVGELICHLTYGLVLGYFLYFNYDG